MGAHYNGFATVFAAWENTEAERDLAYLLAIREVPVCLQSSVEQMEFERMDAIHLGVQRYVPPLAFAGMWFMYPYFWQKDGHQDIRFCLVMLLNS